MRATARPLLAVLLAVWALVPMAPAAEDRPAVRVMVLEVRAEALEEQLAVPGRTRANRRVEVEAETTGPVISEPLRRGARVATGDLLCRIDPGSRPAQLREAEARLAEARVDAAAAASLSEKGFAAETTRMTREAELGAAEASVDLISLEIQRLEIRAPFAGILETDAAELGSRLETGETCATVIDLSRIRVVGFVAERAVDRLTPGAPAQIRLVTGGEIEGRLTFIASVADPDTRTYEVEVTADNADGAVRDGMTAELVLAMPPVRAHRLPQSALTLDDDGRLGVRLAEAGPEGETARFVPVRVLSDRRAGVWVLGLPETARVIVIGQDFVRHGGRIETVEIGWGDLG